jgi:chemotaxis protein methyltransferase CheR
MNDQQCVAFLQWALPKLDYRWAGFRKVRGQVCKSITKRIAELGLRNFTEYRMLLRNNRSEWKILNNFCHITISRFYRDRRVWQALIDHVLPTLAARQQKYKDQRIRCWSAGCGAGEEPYTLAIAWQLQLKPLFPRVELDIIATDANENQLRRACEASYPYGSLKDLPPQWRDLAFTRLNSRFQLREEYKRTVKFERRNVRQPYRNDCFHIILCRNLAFTYFSTALQSRILNAFHSCLRDGGILAIGAQETLPLRQTQFTQAPMSKCLYYKL